MTARPPPVPAGPAPGRLMLAAGIVGLGVFYLVETAAIRVLPTYARVGPRLFPYLVAAGLVLLGALLLWRAWRGLDGDGDPVAGPGRANKLPMALVVGGLILQSLIIDQVGFVIAATLTFVLTAAGFGSRRWLLNGAIGLALAITSYVGFTRALGLSLPAGLLEGLL